MIKFCLVMIVRDEATIIERCLTSMQNIADSYYIMDTGSKDNTPEIIQTFMQNINIPGELESIEWKNFGYNKSLLLKNAREHSNPAISQSEYYIWLDADEVWITNKTDPLSYFTPEDTNRLYIELQEKPNTDIFNIRTLYGTLEYFRWNIVRNNQLYVWKQPVHEYLEGTVSNVTSHIEWFYLLARKEGNSSRNPERQLNDIRMFEEFLAENPDEPRATFYLAQSYEDVGNKVMAEKMYRKRIQLEGYYNERYIACLRLGRILQSVSGKKRWWLEGTLISPMRLECYYELMMLEHNNNNHRAAIAWGLMASINRHIDNSFMFAEKEIYNYKFDMFFAISAYYAEQYKLGYDANIRAVNSLDKNHEYYNLLVSNLQWFLPKISQMTQMPTEKVPRQEFIVIENFYPDPDSVRKDGLLAQYNVTGNFPGTRSKPYFYDGIREKFERIIGRPITYWPTDKYNGAFQWTTANMKSWIHRDLTEWSAIVFLTPGAPADGGTRFYTHKDTNLTYAPTKELEDFLQKDTFDVDKWVLTDTIGNVYNRCVLFRGKRTHISDRYFGDCLENGRLFQMFFFNDNMKKDHVGTF